MGNKWINYRLLVVCILWLVAILGLVNVDRTSAESTQMIKPRSVPAEVGEVAYVPLANTNRLELIDTQTHALIDDIDTAQFGCTSPQRARLNPDGTELYLMCNSSQNIVVLKTLDLSLVATIDRPNTCLQDIAFVKFGDYALATTSYCYDVYQIDVIDTATHTIVQSIPTQNILVISIAAHPFLPQAYAAGGEGYETGQVLTGHVLVINTDTFTIDTMIPFGELIWDVQPSPDGQWVYASEAYDEGIAKIEVEHSEIVDFLPFNSIYGLDISPDGSVLYGSDSWNSQIAVFNTNPLEFVTNIDVGAATSEVELTCDGSELYVATDVASIPVIDTATYTVSDDIPVPGNGSAFGIAICPQYVTKGIFLDPPDQIGYDRIGETISYTLQLSNQTGMTDSYNLGVLPGSHWTTSLSTGQIGPIQDGESISFTASVDISPDALPGEFDTASIQATSVLSPAQFIDTAAITTTALSNNLAYVTQSNDALALIDPDLHTVIGTVDLVGMGCAGPWRPRLTPSGSTLYVLCWGSSNILALTLPELTLSYTVSDPGGGEPDIVFDADESHAFVSARDQLGIRVIDIEAQAIYTMIYLPGEGIITSIEASPTGQFIYASGSWSGGGRIYVIDPDAFAVVSMIDFGSDVWDITAAADNQWLYASDRWGAGIAIIDAKTLQIVDVIQNTGELTGLALSADGETIFAGRVFSGYVDAYDIHSRSFITSIWLGGTVRDLTMDCTGAELYVAPSTNAVSVINTHTYYVDYSIPNSWGGIWSRNLPAISVEFSNPKNG